MKFKNLSEYLTKLENTSSRNDMVVILADLLFQAEASEIDKLIYLLQGRVAPIYVPLEFGMADKMILRAIDKAYGLESGESAKEFKRLGDIGEVAGFYAEKNDKKHSDVSVEEVFNTLHTVTETNGPGSVEVKIEYISQLLKSLDNLSVRFVSRIPVGSMRLGFSDMTVLDSLSWMVSGDKSHRKEIERAFNARPDLGYIVKVVKEKGIQGLESVKPAVFSPILMARAERLSSGDEIIEKIGKCAIEYKLDGFRLQGHFDRKNKEVKLFTRNLEEVTFMYPDVVQGIIDQIDADEAIFEGEAIAYDTKSGDYLPFQMTTQRKRKHGIEEKAKEIPLKLICFDLLYVDGESLINKTYTERHKKLDNIIKNGEVVELSKDMIVETGKEVENIFDEALSQGFEGILAKKLDGEYQAGARGWSWIKFKRSYTTQLDDTIDCVVMGYYYGQGKRTAFGIGAFLIGVYDEKQDKFVTVAKVGTGLTDDEWRTLAERGKKIEATTKPALYEVDKLLTPDIWVEPEIVVEIKADEITRSTIHTAGRVLKASKSGSAFDVDVQGYALRFPRLERFRDDRKPDDATTLSEVEKMFGQQGKQK
jgi:DNA ligase-1